MKNEKIDQKILNFQLACSQLREIKYEHALSRAKVVAYRIFMFCGQVASQLDLDWWIEYKRTAIGSVIRRRKGRDGEPMRIWS